MVRYSFGQKWKSSVKLLILTQSTFLAPNWLSLIRSGAEPHDSYNHADSSWKFQEISSTTTVILNFVDSAVKIRLRTTAP